MNGNESRQEEDVNMEEENPNQLADLQQKLAEQVSTNILQVEVFRNAKDHRKDLFRFMLDVICKDHQNEYEESVRIHFTSWIVSIMIKNEEQVFLDKIMEVILKSQKSNKLITSLLNLLLWKVDIFHSKAMVQYFLQLIKNCLQLNHGESVDESVVRRIASVLFVYIDSEKDTKDRKERIQSLRKFYDDVSDDSSLNKLRPFHSSLLTDFVSKEELRKAYLSILASTEPSDYSDMDILMLLCIFQRDESSRKILQDVLKRDTDTEMNDPSSNYVYTMIQRTIAKIDIFSSERYQKDALEKSAISIGLLMLQSPLRYTNYPPWNVLNADEEYELQIQRVMERTRRYFLDLYPLLFPENQEKLVQSLISGAHLYTWCKPDEYHFEVKMEEKLSYFVSLEEELLEVFSPEIRATMKLGHIPDRLLPLEERHFQDVSISSMIIFLDIVQVHNAKFGVSTVLARLSINPQSLWCKNIISIQAPSDVEINSYQYDIVEMHCIALVRLLEVNESVDLKATVDPLSLVERLLFPFFSIIPSDTSDMIKKNYQVATGMILCRYLIQSNIISSDEKEMIVDLITRIWIGTSSKVLNLNYLSAYCCLRFFCSLSEGNDIEQIFKQNQTIIRRKIPSVAQQYSLQLGEVYGRIKVFVISRLGILKNKGHLEEYAERESCTLYSKHPNTMNVERKNDSTMIFDIASFLAKIESDLTSSSLVGWFHFLDHVVSTFLLLSSLQEGSLFTEIVFAGFEVPSLSFDHQLEYECRYRFVHSMRESAFISDEPFDYESLQSEELMLMVKMYILIMSLCKAVLVHGYHLYQSQNDNAVHLECLKYQISKVYHINHKVHELLGNMVEIDEEMQNDVLYLRKWLSVYFLNPNTFAYNLLSDFFFWTLEDSLLEDANHELSRIISQMALSRKSEKCFCATYDRLNLVASIAEHVVNIDLYTSHILEDANVKKHVSRSIISPAIRVCKTIETQVLLFSLCRKIQKSEYYLNGTVLLQDPMILGKIVDRISTLIGFVTSILQLQRRTGNLDQTNMNSSMNTQKSWTPEYDLVRNIILSSDEILACHLLNVASCFQNLKLEAIKSLHKATWKVFTMQNHEYFPPDTLKIPAVVYRSISDLIQTDTLDLKSSLFKVVLKFIKFICHHFIDVNDDSGCFYLLIGHWGFAMINDMIEKICSDLDSFMISLCLQVEEDEKKDNESHKRKRKKFRIDEELLKGSAIDVTSTKHALELVWYLVIMTLSTASQKCQELQGKCMQKSLEQFCSALKLFHNTIAVFGRVHVYPKSTSQKQEVLSVCVDILPMCQSLLERVSRDTKLEKKSKKAYIEEMKLSCCDAISEFCDSNNLKTIKRLDAKLRTINSQIEQMRAIIYRKEAALGLIASSLMALPNNRVSTKPLGYQPLGRKLETLDDDSNVNIDGNEEVVDSIQIQLEKSQSDDDSFGVDGDWG